MFMHNLPNFLIIGAAKSGTTSLYYYLKNHPQIFLPKIKEINYFAYDKENLQGRIYWAKSLKEYSKYFKNSEKYKAVGEITPAYLNSPIAAKNIYLQIPKVKIIAVLRNPVDRAYSRYLMNIRLGKKVKPFEDLIKNRDSFIIQEGFYFDKLLPYFNLFDREQIKILLYDDLKNNYNVFFEDLLKFLEVDYNYRPDTYIKHAEAVVLKSKLLNKFKNTRLFKFKIKPLIPESVINRLIKMKNRNSVKPPELSQANKIELLNIYSDNINKLEILLNRDLSIWKNTILHFGDVNGN